MAREVRYYPISKRDRRHGCVDNCPEAPEEVRSQHVTIGLPQKSSFIFGTCRHTRRIHNWIPVRIFNCQPALNGFQVAPNKVQLLIKNCVKNLN